MAFKQEKWVSFVLTLGAVALFFGYAWLPLQVVGLWNAPDEVAAAYFAERVPVFGQAYNEPARLADTLGAMVHPRSMTVVGGQLVPGMWLGLPWFLGLVGSFTGVSVEALELLVPMIAVAAVLAWIQIVYKIFKDRWVGLASGLVLAVHPGWWYYTARGLHPNVFFVSLGILACWFWFVLAPRLKEAGGAVGVHLAHLASGLLIGLMIFTRVHEVVWIAPVLLAVILWRRNEWKEWGMVLLGVLTMACIGLAVHGSLYGSAFGNGYQPNVDPLPIEILETDDMNARPENLTSRAITAVFPFGVREMNIWRNTLTYQIAFFPLWSAFAIFGFVVLVGRIKELETSTLATLKRLLLMGVPVSAYLLALYGSWNFHDNPDPTAVTIGTSYIRYWLPVTVLMTPFAGYLIARGLPRDRAPWYRHLSVAVFLFAFVATGANQVFKAPDEGLLAVHDRLMEYEEEREWVLERTSDRDVIIVERSDKVLFPYRDVIVPLRSERTYQMLDLTREAVVEDGGRLLYWDLTLPEKDVQHLEATRLDPYGLDLVTLETRDDHTLYSIEKP